MVRPLAVLMLLLLLAPEASAQVPQPARIAPTQLEVAAQASFDTSYLLGAYMTQLAAEGAAPSQADIDEAARQYLTNGAALTTVPGSGPVADYFTNGAAMTSVPSSGPGAAYFHNGAEVMAYYPTPQINPAPESTGGANAARAVSESREEGAGVLRSAASTGEEAPAELAATPRAPASEVGAGASLAPALTCWPGEVQVAMAIAREYAIAEQSPPRATLSSPPAPSTAFPLRPVETAPIMVSAPAPICPVGPAASSTIVSRILVALGSALLGGLVVVLWTRPRPLRLAQRP